MVKVTKDFVTINNLSGKPLNLEISDKEYQIKGSENLILNLKVDFFS
jgi:hypothetical protein